MIYILPKFEISVNDTDNLTNNYPLKQVIQSHESSKCQIMIYILSKFEIWKLTKQQKY